MTYRGHIFSRYVLGKPLWEEAGVSDKIDLRIAPALDTLNSLVEKEAETFDFAFIDADKNNYINYYETCMKVNRKAWEERRGGNTSNLASRLQQWADPCGNVQRIRSTTVRQLLRHLLKRKQ